MSNPNIPPGPGRPKGIPNKHTSKVKEAYMMAFEGIGGVPALMEWAKLNQSDFYKLHSKLIPTETLVTLNTHEASLDELK